MYKIPQIFVTALLLELVSLSLSAPTETGFLTVTEIPETTLIPFTSTSTAAIDEHDITTPTTEQLETVLADEIIDSTTITINGEDEQKYMDQSDPQKNQNIMDTTTKERHEAQRENDITNEERITTTTAATSTQTIELVPQSTPASMDETVIIRNEQAANLSALVASENETTIIMEPTSKDLNEKESNPTSAISGDNDTDTGVIGERVSPTNSKHIGEENDKEETTTISRAISIADNESLTDENVEDNTIGVHNTDVNINSTTIRMEPVYTEEIEKLVMNPVAPHKNIADEMVTTTIEITNDEREIFTTTTSDTTTSTLEDTTTTSTPIRITTTSTEVTTTTTTSTEATTTSTKETTTLPEERTTISSTDATTTLLTPNQERKINTNHYNELISGPLIETGVVISSSHSSPKTTIVLETYVPNRRIEESNVSSFLITTTVEPHTLTTIPTQGNEINSLTATTESITTAETPISKLESHVSSSTTTTTEPSTINEIPTTPNTTEISAENYHISAPLQPLITSIVTDLLNNELMPDILTPTEPTVNRIETSSISIASSTEQMKKRSREPKIQRILSVDGVEVLSGYSYVERNSNQLQ